MTTTPLVVGIANGSFAENCWLVSDPGTRETAVIDPGEDAPLILAAIGERDLRVEAIWLTHGHLDHIWGVDAIREATGAPVWLHPGDRDWYDQLPEQGAAFGLAGLGRLRPPDHALRHDATLELGQFRFRVREVPGHSPGHVAFLGHGLCLSGDTVFAASIGRTDLPGGNSDTLLRSIRTEILTLPDDTRILPGHGPETTVGHERHHNPFLALHPPAAPG